MENNNSYYICDGEFEIVRITDELYEEAIEIFENCFIKQENVCKAIKLGESQQSMKEIVLFFKAILDQGVSFAARHHQSKKLAATCVNYINNPSKHCTLNHINDAFTSPKMHIIGEYLHRMEDTVDLYKLWNIECVMVIEFLSTRSSFTGKGLATILSQHAIEYAKKMLHGTVPKNDTLPEHIRAQRPQAVMSVFTSLFTQKIGIKLGFETIYKVKNSEIIFEGKPLSESIDSCHEHSVFAALRL